MLKAIEDLVSDESFHVQLEPAVTALKQASSVLEWASETENHDTFTDFEAEVTTQLCRCLPESTRDVKSFQSQRVDMWRSYHSIRTETSFYCLWSQFISKITTSQPEPTFYQDVTDRLFEAIVTAAFPPRESSVESNLEQNLTYEDANVVRYVAGYVCRKVREKLSHENKGELLKCLESLLGSEDESSASADWVDVVDRGGLLHVRKGTYMLFCAMEEEVREHFRMGKMAEITDGIRELVETAKWTMMKSFFNGVCLQLA